MNGAKVRFSRVVRGHLVAGAIVGAVVALVCLDGRFIAGTGGKWTHPEDDFNAYLVAWHYFVADQWRFPVFDLPQMGYPEGGSVLFNDALPITALPTRILYQSTGFRINPFGWWVFLTYVLQGVMAARVVSAFGVRTASPPSVGSGFSRTEDSIWPAVGAAFLAVCCVPFMWRLGHVALSSHFVILWALALYFESVGSGRVKPGEQTLLGIVTLLINAYLFVMVAAIQFVTLLTLAVRRRLSPRDWQLAIVGVSAVFLTGLIAGYGVVLTNPITMRSGGFGHYSWNLASPLVPPQEIWAVSRGLVRDATGGQYEGEAYLGLGALLLLVVFLLSARASLLEYLRRHRILVAALILFAVFAASNRVYFGQALILSYHLPQRLEEWANFFRSSGRFIWPLMYLLILLPIAYTYRKWGPRIAVPLTVTAILLQAAETSYSVRWLRSYTGDTRVDLIDSNRTEAWMRQHHRVWQFPSWECGGLERISRRWGNRESNRELQLQLLAARLGLPSNSVYMSRVLKNCRTEASWALGPTLEPDTLYLLGRDVILRSPKLAELAVSQACVRAEWGYACSTQWMTPRDASAGQEP